MPAAYRGGWIRFLVMVGLDRLTPITRRGIIDTVLPQPMEPPPSPSTTISQLVCTRKFTLRTYLKRSLIRPQTWLEVNAYTEYIPIG